MKSVISILVICMGLLLVTSARAQSFAFSNAARNGYNVGGGAFMGSGKLQPGFLADASHVYSMDKIRPDFEAYGGFSWRLSADWCFIGLLGGGAAIKGDQPETVWSARSFLVLTQTTPVAFRTSNFVMWAPSKESWFVEQRFGPSIKLNQSNHRLFPYLAVNVTTPGTIHRADVGVSPGCTFLMNF